MRARRILLAAALAAAAVLGCTIVPMSETYVAPAAAKRTVATAPRDSLLEWTPNTVPRESLVESSPAYALQADMVSMQDPQYPDSSKIAGEEGAVVFRVYVDATGHVVKTRIIRSVSRRLDAAALQAVRTAVFKPARKKDGSPVAAWIVIPIEYKLH